MSKLNSILEKYRQYPHDGVSGEEGGEQDFMDKHTDNVQVHAAPGADDAKAKNAKHDRSSTNQGYEPGEDEEVYEMYEIDGIIESIIDEYYAAASAEEIADLEAMLQTEEGQDMFLDAVFEELDLEFVAEEDELDEVAEAHEETSMCPECGCDPESPVEGCGCSHKN